MDDDQINDGAEEGTQDSKFIQQRKRINALEKENAELESSLNSYRAAEKQNRFAKAMGVDLAPGENLKGARAFMVNAYDGELTEEAISAFLIENGETPASKELNEVVSAQSAVDGLDRISESSKPQTKDEDREAAYIAAYEAGDAEAMIKLSLDNNPLTF